ncbi:hypothetical protein C8Q75DRAFT_794835 [Abortiporus biennis]|nr:hypothetical protein C8Q75DRAFT_794835 [Abortiporus biennis]
MSHFIQPRSVNSYLSGICNQLEHLYPDICKSRKSPLVTRTLAGFDDLLCILSAFPSPIHDDLLFSSITFSGFFALHCLGKLTLPDSHDLQDVWKLITHTSVQFYMDSYGYMLPTTKNCNTFEGNVVIIASYHGNLNPLPIFKKYLSSCDDAYPYLPYLFLTSAGIPPTRQWYLKHLHSIITDNVSGHSLHSGGATFFAMQGWPDDRIQKLRLVLQALLQGR